MIDLKINEPVKVSIMGTIYDIYLKTDENIAKELNVEVGEKGGYCDPYEKIIAIAQYNTLKESKDHIEKAYELNLRHEIMHAFMFESGLWCDSCCFAGAWAMNEEMIDWFAIQSPKIFDVFWKLGIVTIHPYRLVKRDPKDDFEKICEEVKGIENISSTLPEGIIPNPIFYLKDESNKAECIKGFCDSILENQLNENKTASARIMAEANRIQTESVGKAYEAQRGIGCPVCGENYPH